MMWPEPFAIVARQPLNPGLFVALPRRVVTLWGIPRPAPYCYPQPQSRSAQAVLPALLAMVVVTVIVIVMVVILVIVFVPVFVAGVRPDIVAEVNGWHLVGVKHAG